MKISAAFTLLAMAHVSSAAVAIQKSAQMINALAAAPGAGQQVAAFPGLHTSSLVTGGSQSVTTAASSTTNPVVSTTVGQGTTIDQSTGMQINLGFPDGGHRNPSFRGAYPGRDTGMYPGFRRGVYQSFLRWAYPGSSADLSPGFFPPTRRGFFSLFYPGLLEAARNGCFGRALSRYFSEVRPGLLESLYGSRLFGYGARYRGPASVPDQPPAEHPSASKPVSAISQIGSAAVSQNRVVASGMGGSAVILGQQQTSVQAQSVANLQRRRAE